MKYFSYQIVQEWHCSALWLHFFSVEMEVQLSIYWYVFVLQEVICWVKKVEFYTDSILFEFVYAVFSWMHVLQLRIKVIYKRQLFWRTRACVWLFLTANILFGRSECILNKQLGMEVYMKLMIWRLEWTVAVSKNFFVEV